MEGVSFSEEEGVEIGVLGLRVTLPLEKGCCCGSKDVKGWVLNHRFCFLAIFVMESCVPHTVHWTRFCRSEEAKLKEVLGF